MVSSKGRTWLGFRSEIPGIALLLVVSLVGLGSAASAFGANTYYVSKSMGNDTNGSTQAQSKSTPWAHLPGMASCTSNCASYTPTAGDRFILMGCDVWANSDLPVTWTWSGSSGNVIYIGVDKTWYNTTNCASAWNRPVWNAQKSAMSGDNYFFQVGGNSYNYVELDSIEITELEITTGTGGGIVDNLAYNATGWTFTNLYIHAWDASADNCVFFRGTYNAGPTPTATNIVYSYNVIDGSDRTGSSGGSGACYAYYYDQTGTHVLNNVIRYIVNPFVVNTTSPNGLEIGGNLIDHILTSQDGSNHCNMIETNGGGPFIIHDNVMSNFECAGGETLWIANFSNEVDYVWNNVIYNLNGAQTPNAGETNITGVSVYYWNNTVVPPSGATCLVCAATGSTSMTTKAQNNHCISTASNAIDPTFSSFGTLTNTNNLLQTPTQADADVTSHFDQYTSSQTHANSPVASTNSTVGQGTNLTSLWPSGYSTNDAQYGVTEQTINGVVQAVLGRTTNTRSGAWDIGAYEFNTQDPPPPNPPTGLQAVVK